jgi:hypothetical protein
MSFNQRFGWLFAGVSTASFFYFQYKHAYGIAITSVILAIIVALITIFIPSLLTPLSRAWLGLSLLLGKVVSPITLSIIFFVLIVPIAFITRLFGRDVLSLEKRQVSSYWVDKESLDPESFKNQF